MRILALLIAASGSLAQGGGEILSPDVEEIVIPSPPVVEGPVFYANPEIRSIVIQGNNHTREEVIRREVTLVPGEVFTEEEALQTRKAVMSIGAFANVDIQVADPESPTSDVLVSVTEFNFPLPYPIIGIDASSGWYLGGGALYPNLAGRGIKVDAGGEIGLRRSTPRWKGYASVDAPLTYNRWHAERLAYVYSDFWRKDAAITRREHRASYRQSVRPWRPLTLSLEAGFLEVKAFSPDSAWDTPPTFSSDTTDQSIFIQPSFTLDFRDDASFPTRGALVVGSFSYNPGLKQTYQTQLACSLSVAGYCSIGKTVLAANVWTFQQLDSIPVYNTLYLGHARIVRGWADTCQVDQCLSVASFEARRWFASYDIPVLGELRIGGNLFFDIGAAHEPGLPPLYLADTRVDTHDGLLTATGIGIALELIGFSVKGEIAWGIGAKEGALAFIPVPIRFPVYFGWRF
jgi:outer membrane protein assembly factor BamA